MVRRPVIASVVAVALSGMGAGAIRAEVLGAPRAATEIAATVPATVPVPDTAMPPATTGAISTLAPVDPAAPTASPTVITNSVEPGSVPASSVAPMPAPAPVTASAEPVPAAIATPATEAPSPTPTTSVSTEPAPGMEPTVAAKPDTGPAEAPKATSNEAPPAAAPAPAPEPAFALAPELTERLDRDSVKLGPADRADRRALATFYAGRQHAPVWVSETGLTKGGEKVLAALRNAGDYGLDASAFKVAALPANPTRADLADAELAVSAAALKYARHARGGRTEPTQLSRNLDRRPQLLDPVSVISELARAGKPGTYLASLNPRHPQFEKLRQAYLAAKAGRPAAIAEAPAASDPRSRVRGQPVAPRVQPPPTGDALTRKLLVNMEQWRWMPEAWGDTHVWVNVPEFTLRVSKAHHVIHTERVVTGLPDKQTPIFSEDMREVIFHPFWGVPDSIKRNELWPGLARGQNSLARNGLKVQYGGRDIDPTTVDWATTDLRKFHVYQPPGGSNVLGVVKFRFPNAHDVYMHDTPSKSLFEQDVRAFSHGCMRVRNPVKFAEILLAEDKGWPAEKVRALATPGALQNNQVNLTKKIPVHVTYFTAWVDDDGRLRTFNDIYGHENRIQLGLEGKAHLIAQQRSENVQVASGAPNFKQSGSASRGNKDWMKAVFGF